ncbi:MAG TPA: sigma-70 family RNA polymerase sigma factor [Micromonosporaceae bacterium]|nr:sigma-70 family RNA polymerase sigma factor [Micromonosporaceae bacterium]
MGRETARPGSPHRNAAVGDEVTPLLLAARDGDQSAWDELVRRFSGRLWAVCRSYGLGPSDAADVFQLTWLRLLEHMDSIRDPERLAGWLGTTCRNETLAQLRRRGRTLPFGDDRLLDNFAGELPAADLPTMITERDTALWRAFGRLSDRCQRVLRTLVLDPVDGPPSYELAAEALDMPVGSLGPTRGRCLAHLRKLLDVEGIHGLLADS